MTNYEKFIEIFGETNGKVKASEAWLDAEYEGPVHMSEREKFLEWLDEQICIRYVDYYGAEPVPDTDAIMVKNDKNYCIMRVSDFGEKPGYVYVRIDGLCGWKSISDVKEIIRKASRERIDHEFGFDKLYNDIFRR